MRDVLLQLTNEIETKLRIISEFSKRSGYKYGSAAGYVDLLAREGTITAVPEHLIAGFLAVRNKVVDSTGDLSASLSEDAIYVDEVILIALNKIYESLPSQGAPTAQEEKM